MLYSYNLLKSSYQKNEEIVSRMKNFEGFECINLNKIENRQFDGTVDCGHGLKKLEMKQRQDNFIESIFNDDPIYNDFQLIATHYQEQFKFEEMCYLIYDITMRYVVALTTKNINFERIIESKTAREHFIPIKKYVCKGYGKIYDLETGEMKKINFENLKEKKK